ncbi:MAG: hypothetical protein NT091_03155 [Candidatus Falkowbacteria bacterium]|nr:hypothetical protein [Candidatus Falkowbacteria bacterium]
MDARKGIVVSRTNLVETKKEVPIPWKGVLFLFFLTFFLWLGTFIYSRKVEKQISDLQSQIIQSKQTRDYKKIALVADSESRLQSIKQILDKRSDWENLLKKIEENTIPDVTYTQMDATLQDNSNPVGVASQDPLGKMSGKSCLVNFSGTTKGLDNLARQIAVFQESKDINGDTFARDASIQKVELRKTETADEEGRGIVDFVIQVDLNPNILDPSRVVDQQKITPGEAIQ